VPDGSWTRPQGAQSLDTRSCDELYRRKPLAATGSCAARASALDTAERLEEPSDFVAALDADSAARENCDDFKPSSRKGILSWVVSAKRPETRARRIDQTIRMAAMGLRAQFDHE